LKPPASSRSYTPDCEEPAKVLLPGPTVLARLVASVRDQAATRLWQSLAMAPDAAGRARLEGLLVVGDGECGSTLDRLRRGPTSVTAAGLLGALHRLEEIRALGVGGLDLTFVSPGRLEELARYALTAKAQAVARMGQQRRTATLLAAARHLETAAGDDRYSHVRRFLPALLDGLHLDSTAGGQTVLTALDALRSMEGRRRVHTEEVPLELATGVWRRLVTGADGLLDRRAYTFCVLERLREALRRRDVYAPASSRWADPRARLLTGHAWEGAREEVCRSLGHDASADRELTEVTGELDAAYRAVAARLPENTAVRIETVDGRDRPVLTALDRLDEPPSLLALREQVTALLPRIDLPDLLLEVADWTGFPVEFTHVSEGTSRAEDLHLSVCAVLVAEACNIGLEPLVEPGRAALTRARLSWVEQNYLRTDTLTAANTRLVDAQTDIDLARTWGGGEVASADGLRFVVPVRTLNAGPNPRYFGPGRGVTYLNFLSDQFSGFHAVVVPGTLRDSLYILEGLLEQHTSLRPAELMTDNAGYTDQVFGLFRLLGYQFRGLSSSAAGSCAKDAAETGQMSGGALIVDLMTRAAASK